MIRRTDVTYGQLDKLLLSLGFKCRIVDLDGDARVYKHDERPGATLILPAYPKRDKMLDYHLVAVRTILDLNGIVEAEDFAGKFKKLA